MLFLLDCLFWLWANLSFSSSEVEAVLVNNNPDWIFDYGLTEQISIYSLVNSISPILNYDMERYIDDVFINSHTYYTSINCGKDYNSYLEAFVIKIGSSFNLNEDEAYLQVFLSTIKKMYVFNYNDSQLDTLDYFILNWAKYNLTGSEIVDWRNMVLNDPDALMCMYFHVDAKVLGLHYFN